MISNCTLVYLLILEEPLELTKSPLTFGGGHASDTVTVLTLKCRSCHAQVARSTLFVWCCTTPHGNSYPQKSRGNLPPVRVDIQIAEPARENRDV